MIVSGSTRVKDSDEPIPALQRFDGNFARMIRKYCNQMRNIDILFLSPAYGLVKAEEKIGLKKHLGGSWRRLKLTDEEISDLREANLSTLRKLFTKRDYDEIYINVGKSLLETIEGFDKTIPSNVRITYSQGRGIGPKMTHMRKWIESQRRL